MSGCRRPGQATTAFTERQATLCRTGRWLTEGDSVAKDVDPLVAAARLRDQARRCRTMAASLTQKADRDSVEAFAAQLDERARALEQAVDR